MTFWCKMPFKFTLIDLNVSYPEHVMFGWFYRPTHYYT